MTVVTTRRSTTDSTEKLLVTWETVVDTVNGRPCVNTTRSAGLGDHRIWVGSNREQDCRHSPGQANGPGATSLSFTWDGQLMIGVNWSGAIVGSLGFGYDSDFRVASDLVTAPTGSSAMRYGFDPDSLLTCASPTSCNPVATDALTLSYRSDVPLLSGTAIGTITDAITYNSYGELASSTSRFGTTLLYSEVLDTTVVPRDMLGRIVQKAETRGATSQSLTYSYDLQGRLTDVRQGAATVEHFEYDPNGNRLVGTVAGTTHTGTYDDQDRLLTFGPYTYGYTPNGELFTKTDSETGDVTTYHYDALGNLLSVELPDSTLIEYVIDGQNRRIGKKVDGVLVRAWLYKDQLKQIAELDGSGNLTARFVYGSKTNVPDVVMKYNAGLVTTYRVISDHLGSPIMAVNVNNSADVPFKAEYSAFGERAVTTGAASEEWMPFGFAGGMYDADTGLSRFGLRDYDAVIGRWTAKDPIGWGGMRTNLYGYANFDPINKLDATGTQELGTNDCSYYDARCIQNSGSYYCDQEAGAPYWCRKFPTGPDGSWSSDWAWCTRSCLQQCDAAIHPTTDNFTPSYDEKNSVCQGLGGEAPDNSMPWKPWESPGNFGCHAACYSSCAAFATAASSALY